MFDLLLRRARLVDDPLTDIAIKDCSIAALGEISAPAHKTIALDGKYYASAGWIDSHVHCYPNSPIYHDEPDSVGIATGVTTVIDAGSIGADDVDDFYQLTRKAATDVYALLNISRVGLIAQNELANMANIDADAVKQAVACHPDFIVGLKARMSSSVVSENGITPLERAKAIQQENGDLPLMVHIGNNPPNLDEIAELLSAGDIITHCYNGKPNRILTPQGELRGSIVRALGGGKLVEAGYANECSADQLAAAITPRTAAILYIKSHHCVQKSMLNVAQAASMARSHNLPLIVDAAAEEDLHAYYRAGADLVIYSGAKAIEGPTSGLVIGKTQYVEWVKRQSMGIGRAMKVGKEGILGLTCAIEHYLTATKESGEEMVEKMTPFINQLHTLNGVTARVVWDSAGRDIACAEIKFDEAVTGIGTGELVDALKQGQYAIYFRGYKANEGIIEADVRSVDQAQLDIVARRIAEVIKQEINA